MSDEKSNVTPLPTPEPSTADLAQSTDGIADTRGGTAGGGDDAKSIQDEILNSPPSDGNGGNAA